MTPAFTTIVVPTDFSDCAEQALRYAETLASAPGVSLHLLHVVDMPIVPMLWSAEMYVPDLTPKDLAAVKNAEHRLERQCRALADRGLNASPSVVLGTVPRGVVEYASEISADLVVMSTHGRTGLAHLTMGSVAEQVVRLASCPVLTIRPLPGTLSRRGAA